MNGDRHPICRTFGDVTKGAAAECRKGMRHG